MECGIVGLPNVGKSTLFNALIQKYTAASENYAFCTIDPNIAEVKVVDHRLEKLSDLAQSAKIVYSTIKFVDIAGLIKGASQGEGLGNKFLSNIKEVDGIIHVLRCFESEDITHVYDRVSPEQDLDIIQSELMLADLEYLYKQKVKYEKLVRLKKEEHTQSVLNTINKQITSLESGSVLSLKNVFNIDKSSCEYISYKTLNLLTSKPSMYVCNVSEDDIVSGNKYSESIKNKATTESKECVLVSAQIESEICQMDTDAQKEFLDELSLTEPTMNNVIRKVYDMLNCQTFFTVGEKEARGWSIKKGATALEAASKIHTDISDHFICAEVLSYDEFVEYKSWNKAKELGKLKVVGRNYIVRDGDVIIFKHNAK